jgi:uncharacterized protein YwgA
MIHILQECGHDFDFDFKLALYGAYSSTLQSDLETFVKQEYIKEIPETTTVINYPTSRFEPSDNSTDILSSLGYQDPPDWYDLAIKLNSYRTRTLEATSTIMYLRGMKTHEEQLKTRFVALKPHLSATYESGLQIADELRDQLSCSSR